ncbi:MAG: enoyl-CoA hydratase [Hyphomicrobiaceae bacterium]
MSYTEITYAVDNGIARLTHNRPRMRNAESQELLAELDDAVKTATADAKVRVLVFDATGDHFSAGHDLKQGAAQRAGFSVEERWAYEELYYLEYALRIWDCPKPTIASVQGACIAGGFMVANMCDLIVAADDAFFSDPVCHTLGAAAVEVLIHPWVMGARKAKEMLFMGGRMPAAEAYRIGMINKVVPRADLEAETMAMAAHIAKAEPFALKLVKRSINRTLDAQGLRTALHAHFDTHQLSHVTEAFKAARDRGLENAIKKAKG